MLSDNTRQKRNNRLGKPEMKAVVNCWARPVSECSDKVSREHVVSRNLFQGYQAISVHGLSWCKDLPKTIGLESLTAKILCRKHNSELSEVDSAALVTFDAFREATRLSNVRAKMRPGIWNPKRIIVSGELLERWFLKTLINVAYEGEYAIGLKATLPGEPSVELVEAAFGRRRLYGGQGLYFAGAVGEELHSQDSVQLVTMRDAEDRIIGALWGFRGHRFFLNLLQQKFATLPAGKNWRASTLIYHGKKLRHCVGKHLSTLIQFKWSD